LPFAGSAAKEEENERVDDLSVPNATTDNLFLPSPFRPKSPVGIQFFFVLFCRLFVSPRRFFTFATSKFLLGLIYKSLAEKIISDAFW